MVFHPHGWIKAEQIIDFIDHAVEKHGKKVKFLTFKEAHQRLQKSLFRADDWRAAADAVVLADVNNDGYLDIVDMRSKAGKTYLWDPELTHWNVVQGPDGVGLKPLLGGGFRFGVLQKNGNASVAYYSASRAKSSERYDEGAFHFDGKQWVLDRTISSGVATEVKPARLLDLDGDGICEKIDDAGAVFKYAPGKEWLRLPFALPAREARFLDLRGGGKLDLVFADEKEFGVYLFSDMKTGYTKRRAGKTGDVNAIPMITRRGTNNGCWAHSGQLWWANEDTVLLRNNVDRRSFKEMLEAK
jgi:hypothetical protein